MPPEERVRRRRQMPRHPPAPAAARQVADGGGGGEEGVGGGVARRATGGDRPRGAAAPSRSPRPPAHSRTPAHPRSAPAPAPARTHTAPGTADCSPAARAAGHPHRIMRGRPQQDPARFVAAEAGDEVARSYGAGAKPGVRRPGAPPDPGRRVDPRQHLVDNGLTGAAPPQNRPPGPRHPGSRAATRRRRRTRPPAPAPPAPARDLRPVPQREVQKTPARRSRRRAIPGAPGQPLPQNLGDLPGRPPRRPRRVAARHWRRSPHTPGRGGGCTTIRAGTARRAPAPPLHHARSAGRYGRARAGVTGQAYGRTRGIHATRFRPVDTPPRVSGAGQGLTRHGFGSPGFRRARHFHRASPIPHPHPPCRPHRTSRPRRTEHHAPPRPRPRRSPRPLPRPRPRPHAAARRASRTSIPTVRTSSAGSNGFARKASTPTVSPLSTSPCVQALTMAIGMSHVRGSDRNRAAVCRPLSRGITTSRVTTSGLTWCTTSRHSAPSAAVTTSKPSSSRLTLINCRITLLSSTTRTRPDKPGTP